MTIQGYEDLDLNSKVLQFCNPTHPFQSESRARLMLDDSKIIYGSWNHTIVCYPECLWTRIYSSHVRSGLDFLNILILSTYARYACVCVCVW